MVAIQLGLSEVEDLVAKVVWEARAVLAVPDHLLMEITKALSKQNPCIQLSTSITTSILGIQIVLKLCLKNLIRTLKVDPIEALMVVQIEVLNENGNDVFN